MADNYFDRANQHEVYLHRVGTGLVNDFAIPNLQSVYKDSRAILLDAEEINSVAQLNKITRSIEKQIIPQTELMWNAMTEQLEDLAVFEATFYAKLMSDVAGVALSVPVDKKVLGYINNSLMTLGEGQAQTSGVWAKYTKQNTASIVRTYSNQIAAGYADGETVNQISKRLRNITNGMLKNNADALTRTGLSHYTLNAREALAKDNASVITGRYFNSVFDSRRTLICGSYAAQQDARSKPWGLNDPSAPVLPLHWGERSNWLFLVNDQKRPEGTRAAVGGKEGKEAEDKFNRRENALNKRRDNPNITGKTSSKPKYRGRRDKDVFDAGQIPGATKADAWMRDQPIWFQNSALGKGRAEIFRDGGSLADFTSMTGRPLTLKELKASGV